MLALKRRIGPIACVLMLFVAAPARPQPATSCYENVPTALTNEVDRTVTAILQNADANQLGLKIVRLVSYTIADVVASKEMGGIAYQYYADVARTDKQVGAAATASGSTSSVEKPGLIELIGFAIERGAIQQSISDSTVTLSTSPYALAAAVEGDSPETYMRNPVLTRLNVSATFILNDPKNVPASFSRKQLTEWSAKLRLTGDRSTRSKGFKQFWDLKLGDLEQQRLNILGELQSRIFNIPAITDRFVAGAHDDVLTPLVGQIARYITANNIAANRTATTFPAAQTAAIREMILCTLFKEVHEPVKNGTIDIKADEAVIRAELTKLAGVQKSILEARLQFQKDVKEWQNKGTLSTLGYTNHRVADGSDYSEFKLLFERHVNGLDAIVNANFSIYNKPDSTKNQEKLRDFSISGSLEWKSKSNPLFRGDEKVATPITVSVNGRYERLKENENMAMREPDIGNFQARLEIPVAPGFSIPISYTYATATETMPKRENRFNVGLHLDVDKIFSFTKAGKSQ